MRPEIPEEFFLSDNQVWIAIENQVRRQGLNPFLERVAEDYFGPWNQLGCEKDVPVLEVDRKDKAFEK